MGRPKEHHDPIDAFVRERTQGLRGRFDAGRVGEIVNKVAHQAVSHFSGIGTRTQAPQKPPFQLVSGGLERWGKVQYEDIDPLDRERYYGDAPAEVIRSFELDFLARLADDVSDAEFKRSAGRAMAMVELQPDIDIDTVTGNCLTKYLSKTNGTPLTPGDYNLHVAAITTAYDYAAVHFRPGTDQPVT